MGGVSRWGRDEQGLLAKSGDLPDLNKAGMETGEAHRLHLITHYLNGRGSETIFSSQLRASGTSLMNNLNCGIMRAVEFILSASAPSVLPMFSGCTKARACLEILSFQAIKAHPIL